MASETGRVSKVSGPTGDVERLLGRAQELIRAESAGIAALVLRIDEQPVDIARLIVSSEGKVPVGGVGTHGTTARRLAHLGSAVAIATNPHSLAAMPPLPGGLCPGEPKLQDDTTHDLSRDELRLEPDRAFIERSEVS